jgi:hypothetical protein
MSRLFERVLWGCGAVAVLLVGGLLVSDAEAAGTGAYGITIGGFLLFCFCARQALRGL